jgi:hypothetical protein
MLQLPGSVLCRLGIAALLAGVGCGAPDSNGLFGPAASSPIASASPNPDTVPDVIAPPLELPPPGLPPSAGSGAEGNSPIAGGVSPPSSKSDDSSGQAAALEPDAGPPIAQPEPDAGAAPQQPPAPEPSEPEPPAPPDLPAPEPECGGVTVEGGCWYLGAVGQSCDAVCATRGGFAPASLGIVGTPGQGGSIEGCDAVLSAFGAPPGVINEGFREDGLGFGCHAFIAADGTATAWWLTSPDAAPEIADPNVRIACGCAN